MRIASNANDIKQQGKCKCNQNIIRTCSNSGINSKNHASEKQDSDIEEIVSGIQTIIKDIRKDNFESVNIDN